jgi:hypothetical protein
MPGEPSLPDSVSIRTTGSTVRPDDAASASLEKPALSSLPMTLPEALVEETYIELAWKYVKADRRAPGPDCITITEFPTWFRPRLHAIRQQLFDGTYQPQPVRRVTIVAKTTSRCVEMTNGWLASQGELSLKTLWAELDHLRGTA